MKKLLSILLAVIMVVSLCTVSLTATSAATDVTDTKTLTVCKGDYVSYTYRLDSCGEKFASLDATVNYSDNLQLMPQYSDPTDDTTYKSAMFPKLVGNLVANISINNSILFNFSSPSGLRFTQGDDVLVTALFKAKADGTATISTTMEALADTDLNKIVFSETVLNASLFNPSSELSMVAPVGEKYKYSAPAIKSVSNTTSGVKVTWNKVSGASKYRIFIKPSSTGVWTAKTVTTSTSYTHTSAKSGSTYAYTVRALDSNGNYISDFDMTGKSIKFVATPKITSRTNTTKGVKITWGKVSGASKYRVYVKKKGASSWTAKALTSSTSYTHTSAKSGTTYIYTVRATNSKGTNISAYNTSGWSQKFVATPKVTKLTNTSKGVKVTWGKVSGASKYRVYVKKKGAKSWTAKTVTSGTSYTHTSAKKGVTYVYTIRATDSKGKNISAYNTTGWSIKCKR